MTTVTEGGLQLHWAKAQTTYDTLLAFVAGDAVQPVKGSFKIEPEYPHEDSKESCGTHSLQDEIAQSKGGKWSAQFYIKPAAVGTAPDIGELLKAAMGIETVTGATSVGYTLSDTVRNPLQLAQHVEDRMQQIASGACVEEMSIEVTKGAPPTVSFSGSFATFAWALADEVGAGNIAYNATSLPLDDDSRGALGVGGKIRFLTPVDDGGVAGTLLSGNAEMYDFSGAGSETLTIKVDGGAVQTVTFVDGDFAAPATGTAAEVVARINTDTTGCTAAVDGTKVRITSDTVGTTSIIQVTGGTANAGILGFSTDANTGTAGTGYAVTATVDTGAAATATLSPAIVSRAGHAAGTVFEPWAPAQTTGGTKVASGLCALEIDNVVFGMVSAKVTLSTGLHLRDKEASSQVPTGIIGGPRSVAVELQCYHLTGNPGNASIHGRAWAQATHEVDIRIGPETAGSRLTILVPSIRFDVTPVDLPEGEEAQVMLKGKARQSATAGDELSLLAD